MTANIDRSVDERWLRNCVAAFLFAMLSYFAVIPISQTHWLLHSGFVFFLLWWLPFRYWPAVLLGTIVGRMNQGVWNYALGMPSIYGINWFSNYQWTHTPVLAFLGQVADPLALSSGAMFLKWIGITPAGLQRERSMLMLHVGALISGFVAACKDRLYVYIDGAELDVASFFLRVFLGHFIGIMLIAPLLAIAVVPGYRMGMRKILGAAGWLLPFFAGVVYVGVFSKSPLVLELLRMFMLTAVIVFALRYGWRGAAVSMFIASLAIGLVDRFGIKAETAALIQAFLAVAGAMALLFGMGQDILVERNAQLIDSNRRTSELADELRDASLKMQLIEVKERRQLALELHDEFGQNLTALQTHLQLASARPDEPVPLSLLNSLTFSMRNNVSRILEALRPMALDEVGLFASIDDGSLRDMVEDAGIALSTRLEGDSALIERFDDAYQTAAYRIVQEALTNVVKHSGADTCEVRLRVNERTDQLLMFITVTDDGVGRIRDLSMGHGLRSLKDRIQAMGGVLHLQDRPRGIRIHAMLRKVLFKTDQQS